MANIDNVQLPDGSSYNIVDNTSGFATQNYVDSSVSSVTKTTIGLGNVDNTSDLNKPISTATQAALDTLDEDKADKTDIATVESGTTASRAYSVGELVYVSGTLYRVKTAIASGATFTVGTNVEVTNVSNFLNQFSSVDIRSFSGQDITRLRGRITQIGNVCILIGTWVGSATNTTNILTLPTQYRPSSIVSSGGEGGITINGVYGKSEYSLNTDGTVRQAESVAAGTSGTFTFAYTL